MKQNYKLTTLAMRFIRELAQVVTRSKLRNVNVLGRSGRYDVQIDDFYHLIADNPSISPEEAADYLFGRPPNDPQFLKLKSKLKYRLIDMLFLIGNKEPSYNNLENAFMNCWKEWAAVKILIAKGARCTAISLAEKVIANAVRFEITELVPPVARLLRVYYGRRVGNQRLFEHYDDLHRSYQQLYNLEANAETYHSEIVIEMQQERSANPVISQKAWAYYHELAPALETHDSLRLHQYVRCLRLAAEMNDCDYPAAIQTCNAAIEYLLAKPFRSRSALTLFLYNKLDCCTQLRRFEEGGQAAELGLQLERSGTYNWFKNRELYMRLALHAQRYQEAYEIFLQAVKNRGYRQLDALAAETWKIYEAFIYYLILLKRIQPMASDTHFKSFRLGKFLNEVPHFSRDKRGMNIPILIIQILFSITKRKYSKAVDRIEAVDKYCSRYLYRDQNFRSNSFIKMLMTIPRNGFHKAAVERKTERYLEGLQEHPLEVAHQSHEIEIIPYEDLWEMVVASLDRSFHWSGDYWKRRGG